MEANLARIDAKVAKKLMNLLERAEEINRSEEHTSELQSHSDLVCRLLLEKKKKTKKKKKKRITNSNNTY